MRASSSLILSTLLLAPLVARPAVAQPATPGEDYRIGPGDVVALQVFEEPSLNVERQVGPGGSIALPLLGDVPLVGRTQAEAEALIKGQLERSYLQRATVTLEIKEYRSRKVSLLGAVRTPGSQFMSGDLSLFQAITAAGGLTEQHGGTIRILRRADNGLYDQLEIPVDALLVSGDPMFNVPLRPNDVVNVVAAQEVTVYFIGEVAQPGAVSLTTRSPVTLLTAIARAGGLTDRAASRILVKRKMPDGSTREIEAHYPRLLAGEEPDVELQEGDLIVVKESFF
ncbi:MAG: polysaccharide biosynthesis/export family protein [Thermoanaerobaculia bacterium]